MEKKVLRFIEENQILDGAATVALAVSGGADSMALAHFMTTHFPKLNFIAAHLHHGLRAAADSDETLVKEFAAASGIEFRSCHGDIKALANERKQGVEETGREERYRFFRSLGADLILTAHHKNDVAETILLHLVRGSGLKGVTGILPLANGVGRPFLPVTKEELYAYCRQNEIAFAEDESNEDTEFSRNLLRLEVMPKLLCINPQTVDALYRFAVLAADEDRALAHAAQDHFDLLCKQDGDLLSLDAALLYDLDIALRRRVLRLATLSFGVTADAEMVEAILALKNGKKLPLTTDIWALRENDRLLMGKPLSSSPFCPDTALPQKGKVVINEGLTVVVSGDPPSPSADYSGLFPLSLFDSAPATLRHRRAGDYLLLKSGQRKKLSDYLIDAKIPARQRDSLLLLAVESRILWIVGRESFVSPGADDVTIDIYGKLFK